MPIASPLYRSLIIGLMENMNKYHRSILLPTQSRTTMSAKSLCDALRGGTAGLEPVMIAKAMGVKLLAERLTDELEAEFDQDASKLVKMYLCDTFQGGDVLRIPDPNEISRDFNGYSLGGDFVIGVYTTAQMNVKIAGRGDRTDYDGRVGVGMFGSQLGCNVPGWSEMPTIVCVDRKSAEDAVLLKGWEPDAVPRHIQAVLIELDNRMEATGHRVTATDWMMQIPLKTICMIVEIATNCSICATCGTNGRQQVCVACMNQYYCSDECQQADWARHKAVCKEMPLNVAARRME